MNREQFIGQLASLDEQRRVREQRTENLAEWHCLLLDRPIGSEADDRLNRLARHPTLGGPEPGLLKAQLADRRGDISRARSLVHEALQQPPDPRLPGLRGRDRRALPPRPAGHQRTPS